MKKFLLLVFAFLIFPYFVLASDKVEINTASLEQLDEIIGIGPALGQRIIDARPFSSVDDLLRVKGIGEKTLQKIKDQGLACVGCQIEQLAAETITETPVEIPDGSPAKKPAIKTYPGGVIINEILPSPEGPDATDEWIELFNQNNFEIDLFEWQITDTIGKTTIYTFPNGTKISAQGFLVFARPETKITLNNDEDGLLLIQPNGNILDSVNYQKAPQGQSYNRAESNWVWNSILTPVSKNILTQPEIKKEAEEKSEALTQKPKDLPETKNQLASITEALTEVKKRFISSTGEQIPKSSKIFLIALALAIFSGTIIILLKKKLRNASDID